MPNRLSHLGAPPASFKIEDLRTFCACNVAGGVAGVAVDLILFPLDTIKTRLQSPQGFNKAGGFRGIYAGVPSAAIGSFPNAAAFFITYEYVKWFLHTDSSSYLMPVKHMLAASAGEVVACLIRVPSEVVKQRAQVSASSRTFQIFSNILYTEIPFSLVQFPMWESLKVDLQLQSPHLWMWQKQESCWQRLVPAPLAAMYSLRCTGSGGRRGCQDYLQVSSLERQPSVWEVSSFLVLMSKPAACCWNLAERAPDSGRCPMLCSQERGRRASSCSRQARRSVQQPTWCETEPAVAAQGLGGRGGPTEDLSPPPREPQRRGLGQRGDSTISPRLVRYQHQQPLP
ncbi:S-adenosylmethionine mitochondrial carrier protein isoform X7 [Canis lupus familiaris]|uniref:S-adenosylmethionine mitochondrial carrier protein isoform X11 n=1 Tax=Canis lupus dingo TaxID=286419 RepID=UPI0015F15F86|nr:S-adenosylmethionine mitochondrial carrier protein isoform X11 [Canis lupus dingo]XP_038283125.1 S-adenosylmethionine mitochondrial carrier protein isoform X7 [Canis lupus familiaris]XP_038310788.1 S-adenosylmethionine mitochondrial carrier protein isoform X7 [Canis lupus familiaris]XP_038421827.1 S-adenosylmethionine mitochondrial carrier protein isoform X7 [Canis lupus familiaris]